MPESDVTTILVAIARLEEKITNGQQDDARAKARLDTHSSRLDKLERLAYIALGAAIASGVPQLVSFIR